MRLRTYLHLLTKPELVILIDKLNCTYDEEKVIEYIVKGMSNVEIANKMCISTSTVSNKIKNIKLKIERLK